MFGWFQRLLPKKGDFFGLFEAHAATLVEAANALRDLSQDGGTPQQLLQRIQDHEHQADDVIRQVLHEVRLTFLTPFDRGAITDLIGAMDDAIDEMLAAARAIDLYDLRQLRPEMKQIVDLIVEAAAVTSKAIPLLRNVGRNGKQSFAQVAPSGKRFPVGAFWPFDRLTAHCRKRNLVDGWWSTS